MKRLSWAVVSVFALVQCVLPVLAFSEAAKVQIPVGTVVDLAFEATLSPTTAAVGQSVNLKVANDVKVNGQIVIAAGATATGEVTQASKAGAVGKEAQIGVTVKQVQAVDGTIVPLTGTKVVSGESHQTSSIVITILCCILGLLQHGGKAEIAAGSALRATVSAPVEVQVSQ